MPDHLSSSSTAVSRRQFLKHSTVLAASAAAAASFPAVLHAQSPRVINAVIIGLGGRGSGAGRDFLEAAKAAGVEGKIAGVADIFPDAARKGVENFGLSEDKCFSGFDGFQKALEVPNVQYAILATPPGFRPAYFQAAVAAGKHVFMEKPVAVDPAGARQIMATGEKAKGMELCVVTGTQRHHQHDYVATWGKVQEGMIGDIVAANCYWNQNQLWYRDPNPSWSEMEYMIRDWVNWCWLSGDHIVEQHVHNIDVINWFTGKKPVSAVSFGARHRRVTGDQYDFFSTDFIYDGGFHVHSMCRQINGCEGNVSEWIQGTKGTSNCQNTVWDQAGTELWKYDGYKLDDQGKMTEELIRSPYDQEHIDFVTAIRTGKPLNEAEFVAVSTMAGIMGRVSAYTGKKVTWDEMMNSELKLGPKVFEMGPVDVSKTVPVPGE